MLSITVEGGDRNFKKYGSWAKKRSKIYERYMKGANPLLPTDSIKKLDKKDIFKLQLNWNLVAHNENMMAHHFTLAYYAELITSEWNTVVNLFKTI